eukprot:1149929-Pelagomonas_calceolata.AAC.2
MGVEVYFIVACALAGWPFRRSDAQPVIGASSFIRNVTCRGGQGCLVTSETASSMFVSVLRCGARLSCDGTTCVEGVLVGWEPARG